MKVADRSDSYLGKRPEIAGIGFTLALVFACFTLASTSYLAWLYRLLECAPSAPVEAITMVGGYSFQAIGIGLACAAMRVRPDFARRVPFITVIAIHFACAAATMLAGTYETLLALGFTMNNLYGVICAFYLNRLARWVPRNHRGLAFGGGYACSVITTWALSVAQGGSPLGTTESVVVCAVLSLVAMGLIAVSHKARAIAPPNDTSNGNKPAKASADFRREKAGAEMQPFANANSPADNKRKQDGNTARTAAGILSLACITVLLLSLVKNVGFGFPSTDLVAGISLETSRLFYAAGLLIAGFIADVNRKYAALCCIAALVFPFGCLALANEPIPGTILWAVDYLFYGFFSVYRVVLFCDIAEDLGREHIAGFGLLFGRIGDALGTALWLALSTSIVALVAVAAVLFAATIFAFYHLFLRLYPALPAPSKSDQERFESFTAAYGISVREREVLRLLLAERTNAEIAAELFVTEGTVKYHVHNLFKKTGCTSRRELIAKFAEETR